VERSHVSELDAATLQRGEIIDFAPEPTSAPLGMQHLDAQVGLLGMAETLAVGALGHEMLGGKSHLIAHCKRSR